MKVVTVAVTDTNADPDPINYPIPGNDDSITSIEFFLNQILSAYTSSLIKAGEAKAKEVAKNKS
jgi:small subunit ribosomal protein S2